MKKGREHEAAIIKKVTRRKEEGGHGGAWKVAFADFVLALMCLFLVLWVLAARDQESLQRVLQAGGGSPVAQGNANLIEHDGTPAGSLIPRELVPGVGGPGADSKSRDSGQPSLSGEAGRQRRSFNSVAELRQLAKLFEELSVAAGLAKNLQTVVTPQGLRVMLHDTDEQGMFQRGSAAIEPKFRFLLQRIGNMLSGVDNPLLVVGHTDAAQYRDQNLKAYSNWELSGNRAMAARVHLLEGGLSGNGILQVTGMAEHAPLDAAHPLAAQNRRIELLVLTREQARQVEAMFGAKAPSANGVANLN